MPIPTGSWKIPKYTDSEQLKIPKADYLQQIKKTKRISKFFNRKNTRYPTTLMVPHIANTDLCPHELRGPIVKENCRDLRTNRL